MKRCILAPAFTAALLISPSAVFGVSSDVVIGAKDGFAAVVSATRASMERTTNSLVFTGISYDMGILCVTPPIYPGDVESFEFRYRISGETTHPKAGGELFYSPLDLAYSDDRKWRLPPLVRDGEWHVMSVPVSSVRDVEDWLNCGMMTSFRFDPTNAEGGRLEISEIRFRMRGSQEKEKASAEKFNGDDAWPEIKPELFKVYQPKRMKYESVRVESRGGVALPRIQTAGQKVRLRYDYRGELPKCDHLPVFISIVSPDGAHKWSEKLVLPVVQTLTHIADDVWAIEFDYEVPLYLGSGDCLVRFNSPCLRAVSGRDSVARLSVKRIDVDPEWATPLSAKVTNVGGSPCFSINGKPVYPLWGTVAYGRHAEDRPARHSSAPHNFVTVWTRSIKWWTKGDVFDPTDLDRLAEQHRREYPGAYFMWDISIYPPPDWRDAHPDEMALDEQGNVNQDGGDAKVNFSFASKNVYNNLERVMRKVIAYLEQSPYANRIAGYRINSGHTVEWLGWDPSRKDTILDFSPVAQKGFEAFAKQYYPWITDYSVPTLAERRELDGTSILWNQRKHARAIAYHDFYSSAVADGVIRMCRAAKDQLGGRKLIGTYYGYVMTLNSGARGQMRAHFATKRLLDAQVTDFLMSPQNYPNASRQPGTMVCDMKPFGTIQNHGMVPVIEDDTRTHNMMPSVLWSTLNEDQTVAILRRNMGVSLCRNQPFYTYAITSGNEFDFPQFADDAAVLAKAGAHAVAKGVRRNAEIAIVVSESAIISSPMLCGNAENYVGKTMQVYGKDGKVVRYDSIGGAKCAGWVYYYGYDNLARVGAGIDFLLAEDLEDNPGDYKVYVMQACTKFTPSLMRAVEKLRNRNCTIIWTYAPGFVGTDGNSVANMKALTGMDFKLCSDVTEPGVTLDDGTVSGSLTFPKGHAVLSPIFAAVNPDKILGRYSNGEAGLAESKTGKARSVFMGSYHLDVQMLRRLIRNSGVHLYSDTLDPLEANEHFLLLHARNAGLKTIRLPRKTTVIDVFARRLIAKEVDSFTFEAPLHSTTLFYFADDAESLLNTL